MSVTRLKLAEMGKDLERANGALLKTVRGEAGNLAATIAAADRPDDVASAYGRGITGAPRLDLIR